jgi:hypothetical protein
LGIDETNTEEILIEGNEHDWEKQYALVKQYAQSWLCKNDFVYHYHTDNNINTIFYVIGQNTSPNFRHKIYFPYPHLDIKDIFLQDKRVLIYLGNKEESGNTYLIVCSKKYLRDLYNRPCTGEDGWTNFDHIQQHSIKTLENENALLEALTDDTTMHCYQLPVQQPTLCWASINFIHKIKSKNIISRVQLTKDELRNIELLPEEYAQQLKKISVYMPQPKSWGDYGLRIFSAFWDYDLMDACFNSDGAHGKRPFFSDCVYGIAAICAGWSWPVLPVARIFGICGIARYILVGVGRRVGYDPFIDYNKGRYVSLLLQVYALSTPLQIAFATWEIQEQIGYGHLSKVTILAPWVWGLFDGLCMLDSNDSKYISCVYSEIWASKYAVLRRWYNNRKKM